MEQYIGKKLINAKPMNRLEYNQFRGWKLPADENGADEGYLVEYVDGGKANTDEYEGYVSWSPADVFNRAYRPCGTPLQRMQIEHDELKEKLTKLDEFIGTDTYFSLPFEVADMMKNQHSFMYSYLSVLSDRIYFMAKQASE